MPQPSPLSKDLQILFADITEKMSVVRTLLEKETDLLKKGKVKEAFQLNEQKNQLIESYLSTFITLQSYISTRTVHQEALKTLQTEHEAFQTVIAKNMETLSTAHHVTSTLLSETAEAVNKKARPKTYTAYGTPTKSQNTLPIAIDNKF